MQKRISRKEAKQNNIQRTLFRSQFILIITLALFLGIAGMLININFETEKRDRNLKNIAETIARSPLLISETRYSSDVLTDYIDPLKDVLDDIDVISVVDAEGKRIYHSNHLLIGTEYDGAIPKFESNENQFYASDASGPSGSQRRAYAAIYDKNGNYSGFVMAILLMENIREEFVQTFFIFALITVAAILIELMISAELSSNIRSKLMGHEPDVFSAMYRIRDNILESLDEGVIAVDEAGTVQFINQSAALMLKNAVNDEEFSPGQKMEDTENGRKLLRILRSGEKEFNIQERSIDNADILIDRIPIREENQVKGVIGILHNRTEYTKLMEDLTGTRYLVDSMRANNHDFTNKLHVILGLIQMEMYEEAISYIENITIVQRETISSIMKAVDDPALAALLIGKTARASELNIRFSLQEGAGYSSSALGLPSETMVTIAGNLIDNAFEAMNEKNADFSSVQEMVFGIYSKPGKVLITASDTGVGISKEKQKHIFENGFSTKGEGRGTGLYLVKNMVEGLGGTIIVESQEGIGTSFTITFEERG